MRKNLDQFKIGDSEKRCDILRGGRPC